MSINNTQNLFIEDYWANYQKGAGPGSSATPLGSSPAIGIVNDVEYGLYQVIDLNGLTSSSTCTFTISWPTSGFGSTQIDGDDITIKFAPIPESWLDSGALPRVDYWRYYITSQGYSDYTNLPYSTAIEGVTWDDDDNPNSCSVTLTLPSNSSYSSRYYIIAIYSTAQSDFKPWALGGCILQPKIEVDNATYSTPLIRSANTCTFTSNTAVSSGWARQYLSETSTAEVIGLNVASYTETLTSKSVGQWRYTYNFTPLEGYTSITITQNVYIADELTVSTVYNNVSYSSDINATITTGTTFAFTVNISGGIGSYESFSYNYSLNSSSFVNKANNSEVSECATLAAYNYSIVAISSITGFTKNFNVNFTVTPASSIVLEITPSDAELGTFNIAYSENTVAGKICGYMLAANTTSSAVELATIATNSSGTITCNVADFFNSTSFTTSGASFTLTAYFIPTDSSTNIGTTSYKITYSTLSYTVYNQHLNDNITTSPTGMICRKIRTVIETTNKAQGIGTWSGSMVASVASNTSQSSGTLVFDTTLTNRPTAGSQINFNLVLSSSQQGQINSTNSIIYSDTISFSKQVISYPANSSIYILNDSSYEVNYFTDGEDTTLTFNLPSDVDSTHYFPSGGALAWTLTNGSGSSIGGYANTCYFEWASLKGNVALTQGNRYGEHQIVGWNFKVSNLFGEEFTFPAILYVNYNAPIENFTISTTNIKFTNGTAKTINFSMSRTTDESLTIVLYVNGTSVANTTIAYDEAGGSISFIPNINSDAASVYATVIHSQDSIANQNSASITLEKYYFQAPAITLNSITYNTTNQELSYNYTITNWGTSEVLTQLIVYIGNASKGYIQITQITENTDPSTSTSLPINISNTIDVSSWNLSATTSIDLKINSYLQEDSLESYSNSQTILFATPTVAYRQYYLGINTATPDSNAVLDVHAVSDSRSQIVLQAPNDNGIIRIDLLNGTIDYSET